MISQVYDLFAHLGDGFIDACLIYYDDNVDAVVAALCEESLLPPELARLDRSLKRLQSAPSVNASPPKTESSAESLPSYDVAVQQIESKLAATSTF
jgi:hypothetical protein